MISKEEKGKKIEKKAAVAAKAPVETKAEAPKPKVAAKKDQKKDKTKA